MAIELITMSHQHSGTTVGIRYESIVACNSKNQNNNPPAPVSRFKSTFFLRKPAKNFHGLGTVVPQADHFDQDSRKLSAAPSEGFRNATGAPSPQVLRRISSRLDEQQDSLYDSAFARTLVPKTRKLSFSMLSKPDTRFQEPPLPRVLVLQAHQQPNPGADRPPQRSRHVPKHAVAESACTYAGLTIDQIQDQIQDQFLKLQVKPDMDTRLETSFPDQTRALSMKQPPCVNARDSIAITESIAMPAMVEKTIQKSRMTKVDSLVIPARTTDALSGRLNGNFGPISINPPPFDIDELDRKLQALKDIIDSKAPSPTPSLSHPTIDEESPATVGLELTQEISALTSVAVDGPVDDSSDFQSFLLQAQRDAMMDDPADFQYFPHEDKRNDVQRFVGLQQFLHTTDPPLWNNKRTPAESKRWQSNFLLQRLVKPNGRGTNTVKAPTNASIEVDEATPDDLNFETVHPIMEEENQLPEMHSSQVFRRGARSHANDAQRSSRTPARTLSSKREISWDGEYDENGSCRRENSANDPQISLAEFLSSTGPEVLRGPATKVANGGNSPLLRTRKSIFGAS